VSKNRLQGAFFMFRFSVLAGKMVSCTIKPDIETNLNTQTRAEFDQYARDYFREMSHPLRNLIDPRGHYFIELKARILQKIARQYFGEDRGIRLVDVGTGLGLFEKFLSPAFPNILAVDLSLEMLKVAQMTNPLTSAGSLYLQANAFHLPIKKASADLIFMSCVLHHLEREEIDLTLAELARICSPRGLIVFFEHNPFNPFTQWVVRTTPLDRNARLIPFNDLTRKAENAGIHIIEREFFLYGTREVDQVIDRWLPGLNNLPLGGQFALIGNKSGH
jgi:ubiquinone/menaquinone biosynthesis C-methylase UbiE